VPSVQVPCAVKPRSAVEVRHIARGGVSHVMPRQRVVLQVPFAQPSGHTVSVRW
jgi:hypothetical protein